LLAVAVRILQALVAPIEVTAKDARDPFCMSAGVGVRKLPAANLRTASSASARIRSTPRRHSTARTMMAQASAEGSPGRAGSLSPLRQRRRLAVTGRRDH
jgi:hypothetical protein